MKFKLEINGMERSDCTAPYRVIITEGGTLKEFIDEVLTNHRGDWGYIGIRSDTSFFGDPRMEYRWGKPIDREALAKYEDREVTAMKADGGWSRMDYIVTLEGDNRRKGATHEVRNYRTA